MSSLFQGLTDEKGIVTARTSSTPTAGSVMFRGIRVEPDGTVLRMSDTGQARTFVNGVAVNSDGILLVNGAVLPRINLPGGLMVDQNGSLYLSGAAPSIIYQGVGLTTEGRLCIVAP